MTDQPVPNATHPIDIARTPLPPYYAVIFTSFRTEHDDDGYACVAEDMVRRAAAMPGFLGMESARDGLGLTVSYWSSLEDIARWRHDPAHRAARDRGRADWYRDFRVRICKVEREHGGDDIPCQDDGKTRLPSKKNNE